MNNTLKYIFILLVLSLMFLIAARELLPREVQADKATGINAPANISINDYRMDEEMIQFLQREGLTARQLANPHTLAYWKCSRYYEIPCDENGELRTDLTEQEINALYESDQRGDSHFSTFELAYLKKLETKLSK